MERIHSLLINDGIYDTASTLSLTIWVALYRWAGSAGVIFSTKSFQHLGRTETRKSGVCWSISSFSTKKELGGNGPEKESRQHREKYPHYQQEEIWGFSFNNLLFISTIYTQEEAGRAGRAGRDKGQGQGAVPIWGEGKGKPCIGHTENMVLRSSTRFLFIDAIFLSPGLVLVV